MHETQQYDSMSKDQFLAGFNFKNNPEFVLHFLSFNNAPAILAQLKKYGLVDQAQEVDPELIYRILLSFLDTNRIKQLRELLRVPLNMEEPNTITPAINEALTELQRQTRPVS